MYTTTIPAPALAPDVLKALNITGRVVTMTDPDGSKYQAKAITVEGDTWTTIAEEDGSVTLDYQCTGLPAHEDPWVMCRYTSTWGDTFRTWTRLSRVARGVCLAKR